MEDLHKEFENITKFDLEGFQKIKSIGSGRYGRAILCQKESKKVVIKEFLDVDDDPDTIELIKREIINQSECHKENLIVPFLGISFFDLKRQPLQVPFLVMEYGESGSLTKLNKSQITDTEKMIIIYGIAKGIQFLHHIPICHRDLNPNNIVLDKNKYPLICDFGASRQISRVHVEEGTQRGTLSYMSPEMLIIDEITTEELLPSDIFSFGVIVYNILTNKKPYEDEIENLSMISLNHFLNSGKRIKLPESIPSWFGCLIRLCWKQDPSDRPTIDDIVDLFDAGIALPLIYEKENESKKYFEYINDHLHLNIEKMDNDVMLNWYNRLLRGNKKELAMVIDFMLADYFNNANSQSNIGYLFFNGISVNKDIDKAVDYFRKAAEKEDPKSLFYLSEIYKIGLPNNNINIDLSESNRYLQLSANHNYKPATELLQQNREFSEINKDDASTVVIFGDSEVGKTSFISKILNKNANDPLLFPTSSSNFNDYYFPVVFDNNEKAFIRIRDTSSFNSIRNNLQPIFLNCNTQLVILIFDKTNQQTFNNIDNYIRNIRSCITTKIMIIGNKLDSNNCVVSYSDIKKKAKQLNVDYYNEISALKSTNIEMVSDEIVSNLNESVENNRQEQVNIKHFNRGNSLIKTIVVGSSSSGKTSFINQLNNSFTERSDSTVGPHRHEINLDLFTLSIWDTAGQERFRSLLDIFVRNETIFIIMFDLTSKSSFDDVDNFYRIIIDHVSSPVFKILIFGNKNDLDEYRNVDYNEAAAKARSLNADYIEISCKNGNNFDMAIHLIEESYKHLNEIIGDRSNSRIVDLEQPKNPEPKNYCNC